MQPKATPLSTVVPQRIGVLGTGKAAWHHAVAARDLGHCVVAGSATSEESPRWRKFREVAPEAEFVSDGEALLEDASIDALIVSLPWQVMPDWTERLLRSPNPMLIEKPLGLSADAVERAVSQVGAVLDNKLVGYNRRFYGTVGRLRERIEKGGLKAVQVTICEDIERQIRNHGPEVIPSLLEFSSSHMLDLMLHLLGPLRIDRVRGYADRGYAAPFTSINGLLENESGIPVSFALNAGDPSPAGLRLRFDDRTTWHLSPIEMLCIYDRYEIVELRPGSQIRRYMPHVAEAFDEPVGSKPGFREQMKAFLSGHFGVGATPQESLTLHRFIDELRAEI